MRAASLRRVFGFSVPEIRELDGDQWRNIFRAAHSKFKVKHRLLAELPMALALIGGFGAWILCGIFSPLSGTQPGSVEFGERMGDAIVMIIFVPTSIAIVFGLIGQWVRLRRMRPYFRDELMARGGAGGRFVGSGP